MARSILAYAFGQAAAVLDANVAGILEWFLELQESSHVVKFCGRRSLLKRCKQMELNFAGLWFVLLKSVTIPFEKIIVTF